LPLAAAWLAAQFLILVIRSRVRSPTTARLVWAGFVALPILLALNHFVVTPREALIQFCHNLAVLVDEGRVDAIAQRLADDFEASGYDRDAFVARIEDRLNRFRVDDPTLRGFEVTTSEPNIGIVVFDASCSIRSPEPFIDRVLSRWRLTCRRVDRDWRAVHLEALPAPFSPFRDLRRWLE